MGEFCCVRTEESFEGRAKDCSKGFGSRSKVVRFGTGGGLCCLRASLTFAADEERTESGEEAEAGDLIWAGMTWAKGNG